MNCQHKELAKGGWFKLSLMEQLSHIGSEAERAIAWKEKNNAYAFKALLRALELLDLTVADEKNRKRLKEILRLRETLVDYFFDNQFKSSPEQWKKYFRPFYYYVRFKKRSRDGRKKTEDEVP